jgi:putative DNA primase/helicase
VKYCRTRNKADKGLSFPANTDAERSILGAILLNNSLFVQTEALATEDLSLDTHRRIFARMRDLADSKRPIDLVTLAEELECHGELESIGGVAYVSSLIEGVPERPSIAHYVRIVLDHAARRRCAKDAENLQHLALDPSVPATALADVGNRLSEIAAGSKALPPRFSEEALALRFTRQHANSLRYVNEWGCWMTWGGCHWREDCTLDVFDRVRAMCREASAECGNDEKTGIRLASKVTVAAIERLIQSDRRHAALAEQWDSDPWLLNTPAGTVDLRNGMVRGHQSDQYITKLSASGPGGECPCWLRFLDRVTAGDADLQSFLQRISGYCLTGSTKEHALFFMFGTGANGKSVFLSTLAGLLGDYAKTAPVSIFTASNNEQHPTDLAGLRGARFVTAIETEDGRWWAEARIKSLTGGDRITARFMRQDFFEYVPQFKLIVAGNHKPGLRNVDEAIRRRLHLVPFTVTIPEQERDPDLTATLQAEYSGILQWAIQGCLAWQQEGLNPPTVVRDATRGYLAAEDVVGRWIEERCMLRQDFWTAGAVLYADFQQWCEQAGERSGTKKRFSQTLEDRGFAHERTREARGFLGIGLEKDVADVADVTDVTRSRVIGVYARA